MDQQAITAYLEYLVIHRQVSPATRRTALNAPAYLYKQFSGRDDDGFKPGSFKRSSKAKKLPVVLSNQALRIFAHWLTL
ncbi:MAG: hypothetical protein GYB20_07495 [Oceanospirillales bacterium]|nr:hypothetical protein [Oceanospirillales bacterium]MBR9887524.1 hypothetical protein [Oceanospirillales bacterium]